VRSAGDCGAEVALEELVDETGVYPGRAKLVILQNLPEKAEIRANAAHVVLAKRANHARNGRLAGVGPDRQFRQQRVVLHGNHPTGVDAAIDANAGTQRPREARDFAGERKEVAIRVLGIDSAFDGGTAPGDLLLSERQARAGRDLYLEPHQVEAGDQFRDGVLHLKPGVHLQEIEAALLVHQEFNGSGVVIAGGASGADGGLTHGAAHFRVGGDQRRGAFLHYLLVTPLNGAFALPQVNHIAVLVSKHLDFDVAGPPDQPFHINLGAAKSSLGFAGGVAESRFEFRFGLHATHTFAAAARHCLQQDGGSRGRGRTRGLLRM